MFLLKSAELRDKKKTASTRTQLARTLASAYDEQVKTKPRGKLMHPKCLKKYDKKHPEYRILVCKEEMFGNLLKSSNIIPNSRALFKYGDWFDKKCLSVDVQMARLPIGTGVPIVTSLWDIV
eukprot:scaffold40880_cov53-Attheya_sp.AAC.1